MKIVVTVIVILVLAALVSFVGSMFETKEQGDRYRRAVTEEREARRRPEKTRKQREAEAEAMAETVLGEQAGNSEWAAEFYAEYMRGKERRNNR